jgi:hypothetical protein
MEVGEDVPGHGVGEPGKSEKILEGRPSHGAEAAVVAQQARPATGAEPGDALEGTARHVFAPELAVIGDGEPVGFVADPLEQKEGF